MNNETLEHNLHLLSGKQVIIVRPGYGTQSDSFDGIINSQTENWPIKFYFISTGIQILFQVEDVLKIEPHTEPSVIRLKGPMDYLNDPICEA